MTFLHGRYGDRGPKVVNFLATLNFMVPYRSLGNEHFVQLRLKPVLDSSERKQCQLTVTL